jgi:phosphohistidine swiveling domain-containing protein
MRITSRQNSETVAGVELRQQHSKHENRNESNRDEKYADRLEMFVQNMRDYDVLTYMRRWAACITSDVGITNCR